MAKELADVLTEAVFLDKLRLRYKGVVRTRKSVVHNVITLVGAGMHTEIRTRLYRRKLRYKSLFLFIKT